MKPLNHSVRFDIKGTHPQASNLRDQNRFLRLIADLRPEAARDLLRPFNGRFLSSNWESDALAFESCANAFVSLSSPFIPKNAKVTALNIAEENYQTPIMSYLALVSRCSGELEEILLKITRENDGDSLEKYRALYEREALTRFIPGWSSLDRIPESINLRTYLVQWADKWNLNKDWCLDFALECLKNYKVGFFNVARSSRAALDNILFFRAFVHYCQDLTIWNRTLMFRESFTPQDWLKSIDSLNLPKFRYVWRPDRSIREFEFSIDAFDSVLHSRSEVHREVEMYFVMELTDYLHARIYEDHAADILLVEPLINSLQEFRKQYSQYNSVIKELTSPFVNKIKAGSLSETHLRWYIDSSIPPEKSLNNIAMESGVTREAVSLAIGKVGGRLGLVRSQLKGGRPKGSKDKESRRRTSRKKP